MLLLATTILQAKPLHHELSVQLNYENSSISVEDIIILQGNVDKLIFSLNDLFEVSSQNASLEIVSNSTQKRCIPKRLAMGA